MYILATVILGILIFTIGQTIINKQKEIVNNQIQLSREIEAARKEAEDARSQG